MCKCTNASAGALEAKYVPVGLIYTRAMPKNVIQPQSTANYPGAELGRIVLDSGGDPQMPPVPLLSHSMI